MSENLHSKDLAERKFSVSIEKFDDSSSRSKCTSPSKLSLTPLNRACRLAEIHAAQQTDTNLSAAVELSS